MSMISNWGSERYSSQQKRKHCQEMNLICSMSDLNVTKRNLRSLQEAGNWR